jgi:hypothetical protein
MKRIHLFEFEDLEYADNLISTFCPPDFRYSG